MGRTVSHSSLLNQHHWGFVQNLQGSIDQHFSSVDFPGYFSRFVYDLCRRGGEGRGVVRLFYVVELERWTTTGDGRDLCGYLRVLFVFYEY